VYGTLHLVVFKSPAGTSFKQVKVGYMILLLPVHW